MRGRIRRVICPSCGVEIQAEGTICPHCKVPIRGQSRGRRVQGTRDIEKALKGERFRCRDSILKMFPCDKCGRGEHEAANYRHSTEQDVKQLLLDSEVTHDPKAALALAKVILEKERPN